MYANFDFTFDEWLSNLKRNASYPVMKFTYPTSNSTAYIPNEYKLAIKSLIKVVFSLMNKDFIPLDLISLT